MKYEVTAYCDHVSENHVHCNRYETIFVNKLEKVESHLRDEGWDASGDKTLCPEHA